MIPNGTSIEREAFLVHIVGPNATVTIDVSELAVYHRKDMPAYAQKVSDEIGSYVDPALLMKQIKR